MIEAVLAPLQADEPVRDARCLSVVWAWHIVGAPAYNLARRYARQALANDSLSRPIGTTLHAMPAYARAQDSLSLPAGDVLAARETTLAEDDAGASLFGTDDRVP